MIRHWRHAELCTRCAEAGLTVCFYDNSARTQNECLRCVGHGVACTNRVPMDYAEVREAIRYHAALHPKKDLSDPRFLEAKKKLEKFERHRRTADKEELHEATQALVGVRGFEYVVGVLERCRVVR